MHGRGLGTSWVHALSIGLASSSVDRNQTSSDILRGPATRGFIVPILCGPLVRMASAPALWKVVLTIRNPSALSCWPYLLLAPSTEPGSDFPQSPHWKTPRKGIPEPSSSLLPDAISWLPEELCLTSFYLSVCKPGSPWGSIKGTGCHFHPHTAHKDPIHPHGSDSDNAKPKRQQKPLEPSLRFWQKKG